MVERIEHTKSYADLFAESVTTSRSRGFDIPDWSASPTPKIGEIQSEHLHIRFLEILGIPMDIDRIAFRCVNIHEEVILDVARIIGVMPVFTVGSVVFENGEPCFSCSWNDLDNWMAMSPDQRGKTPARFHAWLTIPGSQVIDFTLLATFVRWEYMDGCGVIVKSPAEIREWTYRPVAAGNDLPWRLAAPIDLIG